MKLHFCGPYAVFEGDVQSLECEKLDPNRMKLLLRHRHKLDVSEILIAKESERKRPHTAYGVIGYKLW